MLKIKDKTINKVYVEKSKFRYSDNGL